MTARRAVLLATALTVAFSAVAATGAGAAPQAKPKPAGTARKAATAAPAEPFPLTPGLVVDASSGRVLHAERATDLWYPASITKLMTVYVALDLVRQGRVSLQTPLTMSESAASQPPSKLGLQPGLTLTLDNAIKVIMVKSANDVAAMIGENLGGSIEGFAALMNASAQRIGMQESHWVNPHGLPDERQWTSARDMAVLARALMAEFPDHQDLFNIGAVKIGNTVMNNHNGLLGRYPGADGLKTGFICSGGFTTVATATQGGRRIIAVVFGHPSARDRDIRTATLFDKGFSTSGWGGQDVSSLPPSASNVPTNMWPEICGPKKKRPPLDEAALSQMGAGPRSLLAPRVAFAPVSLWIGSRPGEVEDEDAALSIDGRPPIKAAAAASRGARPQRAASRASAPGPAAQALTSGAATPSILAGPTGAAAGAPARVRHGAIGARTAAPAVDGVNPDVKKGAVGAAAKPKPKSAQAKPAAAAASAAPPPKPAAASAAAAPQ